MGKLGSGRKYGNLYAGLYVVAYELLRRGYLVSAAANPHSFKSGTSRRRTFNGSECFQGAVIHGTGRDSAFPLSRDGLLKALRMLPNGARASVFWISRFANEGHIIVCEKVQGQIFFIDPQTGQIGNHTLKDANRSTGYFWYRTDNLFLDGGFEWDEIVSAKR